jgi:photosystem II stability/assembly factor-like uncharacterized protein
MKTIMRCLVVVIFVGTISTQLMGQWIVQNYSPTAGLPSHLQSVIFKNNNTGWAVGDAGTIIKTTNGGTNWIVQSSGIVKHMHSVHFIDTNNGWAAGDSGTIIKTTNGGTDWITQSSGITTNLKSIYFTDSNIGYSAGDSTILKTTNGGTNWIALSSGGTKYFTSVYFIDNNTGWVSGSRYELGRFICGILKTTNGGMDWSIQEFGGKFPLNSFYFTDKNNGWVVGGIHIYEASNSIILKTTNGGTDWTRDSTNYGCELFSVHFINNNIGWAVGNRFWLTTPYQSVEGITLKTTNGGTSWIEQKTLVPQTLTSVYFTDSSTGWVVGENGTILKSTNGGVTFAEEKHNNESPKDFTLSQNYPNPFNPSTTLRYSVPERSTVRLSIFNTLGQKISEIVNETKDAGSYEKSFSAQNISTGIYFYRIEAVSVNNSKTFVETKKMVLMR